MKTRSRKLVLDAADAAFILRADGRKEMFFPEGPEDDRVPEHVLEVTMLGFVLRDPETRAFVKARWTRAIKQPAVRN
jgi:hypothetical protein